MKSLCFCPHCDKEIEVTSDQPVICPNCNKKYAVFVYNEEYWLDEEIET